MIDNNIKSFSYHLNLLNDYDFLLQTILYNIAPTLLSEKPSSIITLHDGKKSKKLLWDKYKNQIREDIGLRYFELYRKKDFICVIIYRENLILNILKDKKYRQLLNFYGYPDSFSVTENLKYLSLRYHKTLSPDEIGIFLGFPIEDITQYIKNSGKNYLFYDYWKVYSSPQTALKTFNCYNYAKKIVCDVCISNI